MATYDAIFSGASRPHTLRLTVTEESQDIGANRSEVDWSLRALKHPSWSSYSFSASNTWSVNVNGSVSSGTWTYDFRVSSNILIASGTINVTHNTDGTKTISSSASAYGTSIGSASVGGSLPLTTIPRASTPTFSASTVNAGTSVTIETNRASGSFTHTVKYAFGSATGTIATGVGDSTSWTPPESLLSQIPNSITGTMTITLETYSGGSLVGTKSASFTLRAANGVVPTIGSVTATENVTLVATEVGAFVKGLSRLNVAIVGAAGVYGSTIVSNTITVAGQTIAAASGVTAVLGTSGAVVPVVGTVVDSRGRSASTTLNITVLAYVPPSIDTALTFIRRSDAAGVLDDEGTYLRVDLKAAVQSLLVSSTQKNSLTYRVSTRLRGDVGWTVKRTTTVTAPAVTVNTSFTISSYAIASSWEVLIEVYDKFTTLSTTKLQVTIATATIFMHWSEGLGVGKFWEQGEIDARGSIYHRNGSLVEPAGNIAWTARSTAPAGWLLADGTAVSRVTYADLFAAIGTTYGAGNGSTTFNLPNLKGRVPVGRDAGQSEFDSLGETGGAKTHTLTDAQVPNTQVKTTNAGGTLAYRATAGTYDVGTLPSGPNRVPFNVSGASSEASGLRVDGGNGAHNNLQPYIALNPIIKT